MTTEDPQTIKARLASLTKDASSIYLEAFNCIAGLQAERDKLNSTLDYAGPMAAKWIDLCERLNKGPYAEPEKVLEWARESTPDAPVEQQEPERLTVEDLDDAPVGSVLSSASGSRFAQKFTKDSHGRWHGELTGQLYMSRELESVGHSVLTTPTPVTAETIRASEVGSVWEYENDSVWRYTWTGEELISHQEPELGCMLPWVAEGALTRSTAAPRGDYGKAEYACPDCGKRVPKVVDDE